MTRKLVLSPDLSLPIEAVTEKLGFLGRTGSGKTYAAQKLAELMHAAGAQFIALDPIGKWWSLRLAKDGKGPGIALPVFGGLQGDVPLEPTAGKLIADVIVDRAISAVIDVSQFESDADKARFATDFGARFFFRKKAAPSAVHVFIEEAQEIVPQNIQRGEERMLHVWTRIWKLGRNHGIGGSLISQRPQDINKKVLNQTELLFAFQLTGPQERKAVAGWIEEKGLDQDIAADLPKLKRGSPHVWSPAWLDISRVIGIGEKWTYDASSTPTVGERAQVRALAPIDIEQLGEEIKASRAKADAEDPKKLHARIRELETKLRAGEKVVAAKTVAVITAPDERALERAARDATVKVKAELDRRVTEAVRELRERVKEIRAAVTGLEGDVVSTLDRIMARVDVPLLVERKATQAPFARSLRERATSAVATAPPTTRRVTAKGNIQQRILDTLAVFESVGLTVVERPNVAFFAGASHKGGYFSDKLSALRTAGLVEYPSDGTVALTDAGRATANATDRPASLADLHDAWFTRLPGIQERMLRHLVSIHPRATTRAELATAVSTSEQGGYFADNLSRLRSLGVADYPRDGEVVATDLLFPEGLY